MSRIPDDARPLLAAACRQAGLDAAAAAAATPVRRAENHIWRLPALRVVARISPAGQQATAARTLAVAHHLEAHGFPAVRALSGHREPATVDGGHPVTFWQELPEHTPGTPGDVARLIRDLHQLPTPADLAPIDPLHQLTDRIDASTWLPEPDRAWLRRHLHDLTARWAALPAGLPHRLVHGDPWIGNAARTRDGSVYLLDFERAGIGPPEWDLGSIAAKTDTTQTVTTGDYQAMARTYGTDVTTWAGYRTVRDIRELRMTLFTTQLAARTGETTEAAHRVACLQGRAGQRPWRWKPAW